MEFVPARVFFATSGILFVGLLVAVFVAIQIGRYIGHRSHQKSQGAKSVTDDTLISAILGLMALVVAFTFSGAAGRLDQRERLIAAETSAVSSAHAAMRYINEADRPDLDRLFRQFVAQREVLYDNVIDFDGFMQRQKALDVTISQLQDAAYTVALHVAPEGRAFAGEFVKLVNAMGSAYTSQVQAMWFHPPRIIWITLVLLVLIGSFLAGYKMGVNQRRERLLSLMFSILIACAIYLILCLEFPLLFGVSRLESNIRQSMTFKEMISKPVEPQQNLQ